MPDHVKHRELHIKYMLVALPPALLISFLIGGVYMALFSALGYLIEKWWNCDLDHKEFTKSEIEIRKIPILGPYVIGHTSAFAQLIAYLPPIFGFPRGHNSFWSHFPPVGALLLLVWAWWPFLLAFRYFWLDSLNTEFWGIYFGLTAATWVHAIADLLYNDRNLPINNRFSWIRDWFKSRNS